MNLPPSALTNADPVEFDFKHRQGLLPDPLSMPDDGSSKSQSNPTGDPSTPKVDPIEPTGPDALAEALRHIAEAREYLIHLAAAEIDRFKLRLRRAAIWAVIGLTALVLLLAILVASAGLLLFGVAQLIGQWLGGRLWLGLMITGGGILLIGILAIGWGLWSWQTSSFEAVKERFAARRRRQKGQFGRSVQDEDADNEHP